MRFKGKKLNRGIYGQEKNGKPGKRCSICEVVVFTDSLRCDCCNSILRIKGKYIKLADRDRHILLNGQ